MKKGYLTNLNDLSNDIANKFYVEFLNKFPNIEHQLYTKNQLSSSDYTIIRIPSLNE